MTSALLGISPGWVRPDAHAGDRRFAGLLGYMSRDYRVDLLQRHVSDYGQYQGWADVLRNAVSCRFVPDRKGALHRALGRSLYAMCVAQFWHCAAEALPTVRWSQPWTKFVIDTIDVHFVREEQSVALGQLSAVEASANKARELETYRAADAVIVVSEPDRAALLAEGLQSPVYVVPIIVPLQTRMIAVRRREVLFIGGFGWEPNVFGVQWFVEHCWPQILERVPDAILTIVGSKPPAAILNLRGRPGIVVEGYVPETAPYLARAAVSIAPLRLHGGMKGKVCEALAAAVPLVTTPAGSDGIPLQHCVEAWIGDDSNGFAEGVISCLENPDRAEAMGFRGQQLIENICGPTAIRRQIDELCSALKIPTPSFAARTTWATRTTLKQSEMLVRAGITAVGGGRIKRALRSRPLSQNGTPPLP